jgi:hypothetical protein
VRRGFLKEEAGICLAAVLTRVLGSVSNGFFADVGFAGFHVLIHRTITSPSAIEFPLRASCNSLILLKLNRPLQPHLSVNSLRCR